MGFNLNSLILATDFTGIIQKVHFKKQADNARNK